MTITKERLLKIQHWRETYGADSNVMLPAEEAEDLARIALASLEAEKGADPVVFTDERNLHHIARGRETSLIWGKQNQEVGDIPLYRHAQPVPVVPEDISGIIERFQYQADHLSEWHHIDEHSCKVNRRDLVTALEFMNSCRAAMLQGAEPVSNHDELALYYLQGQKDGLEWAAQLAEANHPLTGDWLYDDPLELAKAIRKGPDMPGFAGSSPVTQDGWISCSERMPIIGELNWRTSFPLLITCEIGVIPAYYGFVRVNGNKHYGFMESLKYGDDSGNHPQTNEYDLISNVTHWMPLPEPQQEVNRG
ncbi:TPA_asm: DUF551 domain-containing protein [Salmonella enterica subsp. enterica serovar Montevideo]|uniref:DUF551 domain-containing protein n=2 Tax=Salmonella enterica TaxID=28901 RepID=A0A3Y0E7T6_SALMO|nr:DUF551 domain-containing protein [Salmonella enterica]EAC0852478.1 DUF551 domain-containing protein [Salmonella enterica subsp. enterica serovar Livingstone]EBG8047384.1 DUF551 domain-containing protein [Salmonella enterica subsp. enterica serovar Oranienburg]EBS6235947.1 DUF551 domain-containing protein [Salmonella enterica subsp. enterica serovar Kedougou]EBZ2426885.1 DUF551 domain-containing protein [Salmonella enterica subsp. enterica serovar Thompson]ECI7013840.1 DUF551 domain-containi